MKIPTLEFEFENEQLKSSGRMEIQNKENRAAELYFYGDIVSTTWGAWQQEDKCPQEIADFLKELDGCEEINMYFNSGGGDAFAGLAIYNILKRNTAHKTAHIDGIAASAATMPVFAADEIIIPNTAQVMIHDPWTFAKGNANQLETTAENLRKLEESYALIYEERLIEGVEYDIRQKMHDETWIPGKDFVKIFTGVKTEELQAAACASSFYSLYQKFSQNLEFFANNKKEKKKALLMIDLI